MKQKYKPHKSKYNICHICKLRRELIKFAGNWICRDCLTEDEPLDITNYIYQSGNLARVSNNKKLEYGGLRKALDKTMAKRGITMDPFIS